MNINKPLKLMSKPLWISLIIIATLCCGIIVYYNLNNYNNKSCRSETDCLYPSVKAEAHKQCKSVCTSDSCIQVANDILNKMDPSVDACHDFYKFACGNFHKLHQEYSVYKETDDRFLLNLKNAIETSPESQHPGSAGQKLKIAFDSCMDTKTSEFTSFRYMMEFLNEIGIVNWPHLDQNVGYFEPHLTNVLGKLISFKQKIFFTFHYKDNETVSLRKAYDIFNNFEEEDAKDILVFILRSIGLNSDDVKNITESFLKLKHTLNGLTKETREEKEVMMNCSLGNTQDMHILCQVLRAVFANEENNIKYLYIPDYYEYFSEEISHLLETYDQRDLAHYTALTLIFQNLNYINFHSLFFLNKKHERETGSFQMNKHFKRWLFCVTYLKSDMILPLGLIYVDEMRKQDTINQIEKMGELLQKTTSIVIREQDWLADDTKRKLIRKITKIKGRMADIIISHRNRIKLNETLKTGNTEMLDTRTQTQYVSPELSSSKFSRGNVARKIESDEIFFIEATGIFLKKRKINEDFKHFQPLKSNFLYNVLHNNRRRFFSKFDKNSMENKVGYYVSAMFMTNAFFIEEDNFYSPTFGMLTPPYYSSTYPKLINLAGVGATLSHEIGHSVYSVLVTKMAGQNKTLPHVKESLECRAKQYSQFVMEKIGQNVLSNITKNEDFSDTVGNEVMERVLKSLRHSSVKRIVGLPSLDYSPEQLYYLSFAQKMCDIRSISREWEQLYNVHTAAEFRVRGILQNSKRFSEVFKCPTGSYMNPAKKCPVFLET